MASKALLTAAFLAPPRAKNGVLRNREVVEEATALEALSLPAYSTSCFSGFVPSALAQTILRMTSGSPTPNDQRMPKCSAT
jgi:hypothetical protein